MFVFLRDEEGIEDIKVVNFARALLMYLVILICSTVLLFSNPCLTYSALDKNLRLTMAHAPILKLKCGTDLDLSALFSICLKTA